MEDEGYYVRGKSCSGWPKVDIELLVLGALRVIGSGCSFDAIEELTNVSECTHHKFFQTQFFPWGRGLTKVLVHLPCNKDKLRQVTGLYERVGLPGCVGSIDCVHLVWDKCPSGFLSA